MGRKQRIERIFLAIPTDDARVMFELQQWCFALADRQYDSNYRFVLKTANGFRPIEYARNYLVGEFLKTDCDRLWFLDADMIPGNSTLELIHCDADVCAGRMFRFDHANPAKKAMPGIALCAFVRNPANNGTFLPIVPVAGMPRYTVCDALGTGSLLVRRRVLEDKRLYLPTQYTGLDGAPADTDSEREQWGYAPAMFRTLYKPNGARLMGEDIDFTWRAKQLGYSVVVDLNCHIGHYKRVDLDQVVDMASFALVRQRTEGTVEGALRSFYEKELEKCS